MKIIIKGITYDTDTASKLAHLPTQSSDQQLYHSEEVGFFLLVLQICVDGQKLGPNEVWVDLGKKKPRKSRLCVTARIIPMSNRDALVWCIKTQIPLTFRGFLLECI